MNEDFVPFELAKKLQEKGCSVKCLAFYTNVGILHCNESLGPHETYMDLFEMNNNQRGRGIIYDAPTITQVLKWLREEKKIFIAINIGYCYESCEKPFPTNPKMEPILKGYYYGIWELGNLNDKYALSKYFEAPEQAVLAGIEYCLDNLI